jgi:hypothetical protein
MYECMHVCVCVCVCTGALPVPPAAPVVVTTVAPVNTLSDQTLGQLGTLRLRRTGPVSAQGFVVCGAVQQPVQVAAALDMPELAMVLQQTAPVPAVPQLAMAHLTGFVHVLGEESDSDNSDDDGS